MPTRTQRSSTDRGTPALVWLLWALAAAASVQLAPNPLYVAVVVALAALLVQAHASDGPLVSAFPVMVVAGVAFGVVRLVLNALTTHGAGDALFTLPQATLPRLLGGFTVGGTVEAPVVARAAAEGWAIVGIVAAFAAFNAVVSHYELVRAAPRAFYELGLAVTVALAFVPSTIEAIGAVREADRARTGGLVVRRGRLLRQVVPVLESGMERAVNLAESMDSRGFGRSSNAGDAAAGWFGLLSLVLLGGSFVALVARSGAIALVMVVAGAASLAAAVLFASRSMTRVRYRPRRLSRRDWALALAPWLAPFSLALLAAANDTSLRWPAEQLALPTVGLAPVVALAALATAPLLGRRGR